MSKKGAKKRPAAQRRQAATRRTTPVEASGRGSRSARRGATQPSLFDRVRAANPLAVAGIGAAVLVVVMAAAYFLTRAGVGQPATRTPTPAAATSAPGAATRAPAAATSTPGAATPAATPSARQYGGSPAMTLDSAKPYIATIDAAKRKTAAEPYPKDAPQSVNNFVFLARDGFYDGLTFHRVEPTVVIQRGDPKGDGTSVKVNLSWNKEKV